VSAPRAGIAIVNFRAGELTVGCLRSLEAEVRASSRGLVVYVVDNASGDNSSRVIVDAIEQHGWSDWVTFLQSPVNGGFAAGNNIAIRRMLEDFPAIEHVVLLNPDTVVRPNAIAILMDFMAAHPEVGIAGGRSEDPDTTPQVCCFRYPNLVSEIANRLRLGLLDRVIGPYRTHVPTPEAPVQIDWVSGACMIIRRKVIDAIGLMDEGYFLYFEETDFIIRALRAGWTCWHVPQARVIHFVGQSTGVTTKGKRNLRAPGYWYQSRRRYFVLNHGLAFTLMTDTAVIAAGCLWKIRELFGARSENAKEYELRDFLMNSTLIRQGRGLAPRRVA